MLTITIIVTLLICSALTSGSETAVTASSPGKLQQLKQRGNKRAKISLQLIKIKERLITTLLVANNIINILATTITTSFLISIYGDHGIAIATLVMTTSIIIFAEVLPKAIAVMKPENVFVTLVPFLRFILFILRPITLVLDLFIKLISKLLNINMNQITGADEVRGIIDHQMEEGNFYKEDRDMLEGVLDLGNITVEEIMIHRSKMESINSDLPIKEIIDQALRSTHTRIPMWRDNKDNIVGILHLKDLIQKLYHHKFDYNKIDIQDCLSEPWFIPENVQVGKQLNEFRTRKSHLAMIVDEYGDLMGLVTLEDILEEIVGPIDDEHDKNKYQIIKVSPNSFIVEGDASIRDLNREFGWNISDENATTLAGFIIHEIKKIPEQSEKFFIDNFQFEIMRKSENYIRTIKITTPTDDLDKPNN